MQQLKQIQIQFVLSSSSSIMSLSSESLELSFLLPLSNVMSMWWLTTTTAITSKATTAKILHKSQKKTFNKHKFKRILQFTIINDMNMNMISNYYDSNAMTFNVSNNINNKTNINTKHTIEHPFMYDYINYYRYASCYNYYKNNNTKSININTKPTPPITYSSKIPTTTQKIRALKIMKSAFPQASVGSGEIEKASLSMQVANNKIKDTDNIETPLFATTTPSRAIPYPITTSIKPISSIQFIAIREAAHLAINTKLITLLFSIVYYIYNFLNLYRHRKSFRRKSDYNVLLKTNPTIIPYNIDIKALSKWSYIS